MLMPWEPEPGEPKPFLDASFYAIGGAGFAPFVLMFPLMMLVDGAYWFALGIAPAVVAYLAFVICALRAALRGE